MKATCESKLWFESAKKAKQRIRRLKNCGNTKLTYYNCDECDGYHLTSKTGMNYKIKARNNP